MLLKTPFILKTFSKEAGKETAFPFFFFFAASCYFNKKCRFVVTLTNIKTAVYIHQTEQFFLGNCVKVAKIVCPYMAFLKRRSFSKESTSRSTGRKSTTAEPALHKVQPS